MVFPIQSSGIRDADHRVGCLEFRSGMGIEAAPSLDLAIVVVEEYSDSSYHHRASWGLGHGGHYSPSAKRRPEKGRCRLGSPVELVADHCPWTDQMQATQ